MPLKEPARVILIDAANELVVERTSTGLTDLQQMVGELITTGHMWPNGDILFVDDEGLLKMTEEVSRGFHLFSSTVPAKSTCLGTFVGSGVIVGREEEIDEDIYISHPPSITVEQVKTFVKFTGMSRRGR